MTETGTYPLDGDTLDLDHIAYLHISEWIFRIPSRRQRDPFADGADIYS